MHKINDAKNIAKICRNENICVDSTDDIKTIITKINKKRIAVKASTLICIKCMSEKTINHFVNQHGSIVCLCSDCRG